VPCADPLRTRPRPTALRIAPALLRRFALSICFPVFARTSDAHASRELGDNDGGSHANGGPPSVLVSFITSSISHRPPRSVRWADGSRRLLSIHLPTGQAAALRPCPENATSRSSVAPRTVQRWRQERKATLMKDGASVS